MQTFRTGQELARLGVRCRQTQKQGDESTGIWLIEEDVFLLTGGEMFRGEKREFVNGAIIGSIAVVRDVRKNFESGFRVVDPESVPGKRERVREAELHCGHGPHQPCGLRYVIDDIEGFWHADDYRHHGGFIVGDRARMPVRGKK